MSWLFLITGVLCLLALQWLRGVLSFIFSVPTPRLGPRPDASDFGGFDLLDETAAELAEVGFGEPLWVHNDDDDDGQGGSIIDIYAVFPHKQQNVLAWIAPGINAAAPRELVIHFTTELVDGRQAVTQVGDAFYSAIRDERTPSQTTGASSRADEYRRHLEFIDTLGAAPRQRAATARDALQFADQHLRGIRQRLLDSGLLKESNGLARPGFRLGLRILWHILKRPKSKAADSQPVPAVRLWKLQRMLHVAANRAPSRHVEWLLLGLSGLLFVAFGWPIFGLQITAILLAVILFHEAGHWAAMRAFGYRNPHITLMPLLGGVAIGHESDPNAAKRAWVSLAGPLPGIALGWAMLLVGGDLTMSDTARDWWQQAALFLLIVNYLNILPVPPLDGSHVLTALLPPRWVVAQILVLFAGVAIGFYLSWVIDFWLLAIIASVQLLFVRSMWRNARLVRRIAGESSEARDQKLWILEQIEELDGPAKNAAQRLSQAEHVAKHLELAPMAGFQRLVVASVFVALLVVPVGFLSLGAVTTFADRDGVFGGGSAMFDVYADMEDQRRRLEVQTRDLELEELLRLASAAELPAPADDEGIVAAEERLGGSLPEELRSLYSIADGLPEMDIGPITSIRPISETDLFDEALMPWQHEGELYFEGADFDYVTVPVGKAEAWWVLSPDDSVESLLFYDPRARGASARVYSFDAGVFRVADDLRSLVQRRWIEAQVAEELNRAFEHAHERAAAELAHLTIVELAEELYRPNLLTRLLAGDIWQREPATEGELEALEQKLGRILPADHRALLTSGVNRPGLGLLSPAEIVELEKVSDDTRDYVVTAMTENLDNIDSDAIRRCWVVFGFVVDGWDESKSEGVIPRTLWCPELEPELQYFATDEMRYHATLTDVVRAEVARYRMVY